MCVNAKCGPDQTRIKSSAHTTPAKNKGRELLGTITREQSVSASKVEQQRERADTSQKLYTLCFTNANELHAYGTLVENGLGRISTRAGVTFTNNAVIAIAKSVAEKKAEELRLKSAMFAERDSEKKYKNTQVKRGKVPNHLHAKNPLSSETHNEAERKTCLRRHRCKSQKRRQLDCRRHD